MAILLLTLGNYAIASPDVIVDASVAQRSSTHPRLAADLQCLCWGALSIGGLAGTFIVAPIYEAFHAQGLFFAQAGTAAAILVPAMLRWLPEKRETTSSCKPCSVVAVCKPALPDPLSGPIFTLAVIVRTRRQRIFSQN